MIVCSAACAGLQGAEERPPTPYGVLHGEWKAEVRSVTESALTKEEQQAERKQISARYTSRFLTLAQEHLDDELWVDCLIWVTVQGTAGPDYDAMFDLLRDNAVTIRGEALQLQLLMSELIPLQSARINPALTEIAESDADAGLRGAALYALAARVKRQAEEEGDAAGCARAEELLVRVVEEYPAVSTYRGQNEELATALLEDLRSPVAITRPAPSTQGETISGETFDLQETIDGKVAVISFSGHWCGPCVAMHAVQKEILSRFPAEAVVVVEMNSDGAESLEEVRSKIAAEGLKWIVVSDGTEGPVAEQWRVSVWPTYFVIDASGRIRRRASGNVGRQLIDWVDELVAGDEQ